MDLTTPTQRQSFSVNIAQLPPSSVGMIPKSVRMFAGRSAHRGLTEVSSFNSQPCM
jgi:hypothetical protein